MNIDAVTSEFGKLISVKKHYDSFEDSSDIVGAYQLVFEHGELFHEALPNTDEITSAISLKGTYSECLEVSNDNTWKKAIGCSVIWLWKMTNQQGYHDGIQYEFSANLESCCIIQLLVEASSVKLLKINKL